MDAAVQYPGTKFRFVVYLIRGGVIAFSASHPNRAIFGAIKINEDAAESSYPFRA